MSQYRPSGFQVLPPVVKNLLIINGLVFFLQMVLDGRGIPFTEAFGLAYWRSAYFRPWQPLTHMFLHGGFMHLFSNMFALYMFGSMLENVWGPRRFLIFYLVCGFGAALLHTAVLTYEMMPIEEALRAEFSQSPLDYRAAIPPVYTVGASGAVFGLLFAFGYLFPNMMLSIYFFLPMKAKYFVALYAAFELFAGFRNSPGDNIAHFAHIGGMVVGFLLLRAWGISRFSRRY